MNDYLRLLIIGTIFVLVSYKVNMWLVPKLQKIHFEKRLELIQLKKDYESQEATKELQAKKEKDSKNNNHNK